MKYYVLLLLFSLSEICFSNEVSILKDLPDHIAGAARSEIEQFPDPRLGSSVGYKIVSNHYFGQLTVIVFDAGYGPVKHGLRSEVTHRAFDAAINDVKYYENKGIYKHVTEIRNSKLRLNNDQEALFAHFNYSFKNDTSDTYEPLVSYLLMTGIKDYMLKIRFTGNDKSHFTEAYFLNITNQILNTTY